MSYYDVNKEEHVDDLNKVKLRYGMGDVLTITKQSDGIEVDIAGDTLHLSEEDIRLMAKAFSKARELFCAPDITHPTAEYVGLWII